MDGYETAALIRQRSQTARIPIIFLSAVNKETEHLMRGYAMGAVDYVFKPVDPVVLQVEGRGVRRPVPAAPADRRAGARRAGAARGQAAAPRPSGSRSSASCSTRGCARRRSSRRCRWRSTRPASTSRAGCTAASSAATSSSSPARTPAALAAGKLRWCDRIVGTDAEALERRLADSREPAVTSHYRWAAQRRLGDPRHRPVRQIRRSAEAPGSAR